jgi:hypothetical protein
MPNKETMLVEYLGDKPKKKDNILNSGAIWNGKGDIVELPVSIGRKLVQLHPDVWGECTDKDVIASSTASDPSEIDDVINVLNELNNVDKIRDYLKEEFNLTFRGNPKIATMLSRAREHMALLADNKVLAKKETDESKSNTFNGIEITEKLQPLVALAQTGNFSNDPEEAVSQAIDMLGGIDSGFYDEKTGMPQLDVIQLLVGPDVATVERIDIAMANKMED